MLHKDRNVILPETFELLVRINQDQTLDSFFLVGGTALALQIGHRFSVDLDLFSISPFETPPVIDYLVANYNFRLDSVSKNTVLGNISGVKVDFITHAYPLVENLLEIEGVRMASMLDIAAMKLNDISVSGQRLKDFIDVFFILERYSLTQILEAYQRKYSYSNVMIPLKAITYFDDINPEPDPPIMKDKVEIKQIQERLLEAVVKPNLIFN